MRVLTALLAFGVLASANARAAEHNVRVELNTLESAETQCHMTFVIENKSATLETLKLNLVVFNTESIVYRRLITDLGPVRAGRTIVKTFVIVTPCAQVGAVLVNSVSACTPGEPEACLDGLALSSRVKNVRYYK